MHITLDQAKFLKSLGRVQRVVEKRNTMALVSNVLLLAKDNVLELKATDLDIEMHETVAAQIQQGGNIATPAHLLYEIIRKLPQGREVELFCKDGKQLVLKSGHANFSLPCCSGEEFPKFNMEDISHSFSLPAKDLKVLIEGTLFAASTEETRYYLNGVYFHILTKEDKEAWLCAVATDGHRLARRRVLAPEGSAFMPSVIVPRKTMAELQKLLADQIESLVSFEVSESKIRFRFDHIVMTSKLIDGTFPDYEKVIPFMNDKSLMIDKVSFASAVDLVATIANEKSRAVKLYLSHDKVKLEVANDEAGRAEEIVSCDYAFDDLVISFNAYYLLDIISQFSGETIKLLLHSAEKPAILSELEDTTSLYVLMPMRI